jgi:hypothetical protein
LVHRHRGRDAPDPVRAELPTDEESLHQMGGSGTDDQGVGRSHLLQPCRKVQSVTERELLVGPRKTDLAHYNQPGVDRQPHGHPDAVVALQAGVQPGDGLEDPQPSPHGLVRVILVRGGVSEVDQHAVAEVLRDVAVEPSHNRGTARVVLTQDLAELLRIQSPRQRGRLHEVTEHHGQLAPLACRRIVIAQQRRRALTAEPGL